MKISYVNGKFVNHNEASIHPEDRGHLFADGVYEVIAFENGVLLDGTQHMARLKQSLAGIRIAEPASMEEIKKTIYEVIARNNRVEGFVYLQITRGTATRTHTFPKNTAPNMFIYILEAKKPADELYQNGVKIISAEETRWKYRNYKTISLLPNILAKQQAYENSAFEAWFVEENGVVTEGSSTNAFIVKNGTVITHPADRNILGGITRETLLSLARQNGIKVEEKPFTLEEALTADEAFLSATSSWALPVVEVDGKKIGNGQVGEITKTLQKLYKDYVIKVTSKTAAA